MTQQEKELYYVMERVEKLTDEIHRINRALYQIQEGKPITEAFDNELYLEAKEQQKSAKAFLETIMLHLLKLKYCTNNRNHNDWRITVTTKQYKIRQKIDWNDSDYDKNDCIQYLNENIQKSYDNTVKEYKDLIDEYDDLRNNYKFIPTKCPWTLDDLVSKKIPEIIDKLPDPDRLTVQMQLYPDLCKYLIARKLSEKIIGYTCENKCKNYPDCISKYYGKKYGG